MSGRRLRCLRAERGQILILTAATLIAILFLGTLIVNVGNWFTHRRHLQTQVDAAALAAASDFTGCFLNQPAANRNIANSALLFAGDLNRQPIGAKTPALNPQVSPDNNVHVVLNSDQFWPAGSDGWDIEDDANDLLDPDAPCSTKYIDVKATDDDVPELMKLIPFVPDIRATARVSIEELEETNGMLPWAVPEEDAREAYVVFFDEQTLGNLSVQPLVKGSTPEILNGTRVLRWTGQALDVNVTDRTGAVILTSRNSSPVDTNFTDLPGLCGQKPVVRCYGDDSAAGSLALVKGNSALGSGTAGAPVLRDVIVNAGNCSQDQSAGYFVNVAGCSPQVEAVVDFGLAGADPATINAKVSVAGKRMTWGPGGTGGAYGTWTVAAPTLASESGQNDYSMEWSTGTGGLVSLTVPSSNSTSIQRSLAAVLGPNDITVTKVIPNDPNATPATFKFSFNGGAETAFEADGTNVIPVANGSPRTVVESPAIGYKTTYVGKNGANHCNNVQRGDTCTITNTARGTINIVKKVIGGPNGFPALPSTFQISITDESPPGGAGLDPSVPSPFAGSAGRDVVINANTSYSVTEAPVLDYTPKYSDGCTGEVNRGATALCEITNTYTPASPATVIVIKSVVGGPAAPSAFRIVAASSGPILPDPSSFDGTATGQDVEVSANRPYTITEPAPGADYTVSYSPDCSGTLAAGAVATCVVTNTYKYGRLKVIKQVSGGTLTPGGFTIDVNVSGGGNATPPTVTGSTAGTYVDIDTGKAYTVSEPVTAGYTAVYSAGCAGTFTAGDTATCTVTNVFGSVGPPESDSFGLVARPYATNVASGSVAYLRILDQANQSPEYFLQSGTRNFTVEVGLKAALEVDQAGDPPILLRQTEGPSSSLTQSIDCDPSNADYPAPFNTLPKDTAEIAYGCLSTYRTNPTGDCVAYDPGGIKLPPTAPPAPNCAQSKPGEVISLNTGLAARFENPCFANNWPKKPKNASDPPDPPPLATDPRWVVLVITDFGIFDPSKPPIVPVRKFAAFYVTGWDVSSQSNGCDENDLHPDQNPNDDTEPDGDVDRFDYDNRDSGDVWGHFGKYVTNKGTSNGTECDFENNSVCIGVLTR